MRKVCFAAVCEQVLIVEDSMTFSSLLKRSVKNELGLNAVVARNYEECVNILEDRDDFFVALLDVNLPDAPNGEIVDLVLSRNIPAIVITGEISDDIRDQMWSKKIMDYVFKENMRNIDYVIESVRRIHDNMGSKILIVDDSTLARKHMTSLVLAHKYEALSAKNASEALVVLSENRDIKLIVIDYNMPGINGVELTKEIRAKFTKKDLAIIGISGQGSSSTSIAFLKNGANDYITKPFETEEFYCRISQNIDIINHFNQFKALVSKDYLTDLYNRKYLMETGAKLFANLKRNNLEIIVALIDLDDFKKINDSFGHSVGDEALIHVSKLINGRFRQSDIVSRYGGEEFCVVNTNMDAARVFDVYEALRKEIENNVLRIDRREVRLSVSIGICSTPLDTFKDMVNKADDLMYRAKHRGKNTILMC